MIREQPNSSPHCALISLVDRNRVLPQSVSGVLMPLALSPIKKGLFIFVAVVLAPVLLVGLVALAAGDWRQIGATAGGDQVLVSSVTAKKNGLRTAWIRVEYKEPMKLLATSIRTPPRTSEMTASTETAQWRGIRKPRVCAVKPVEYIDIELISIKKP